VAGALVAVVVLVGGIVWAGTRGDGAATPAGRIVTVQRGDVAVTVGGIGHVSTLTGAARVQVGAGTTGAAGATGATTKTASTATAAAGSAASGPVQASADAVFPSLTGHVSQVFVHPGDRVVAGQPIARLADDGTVAGGLVQARSDLATARLELAQKRVQDPAHGLPPTPQELQAGQAAIDAARAKLARLQGPPLAADLAAARFDVARARADLTTARAGGPDAVAAAQIAVDTARARLATLTGAPDAAELAAAQLEVAKATVDQETLLRPAAGPSASAVRAADAAIASAQQRLSDALASGKAPEAAAAGAELTKAQSERDALSAGGPPPSEAAHRAAQLAVDAAQRRLDAVLHPPAATVSAARGELAKTQAELAAAQATRGPSGLGALQAAETAARRKLQRLLGRPTHDVVAVARADVRKARADVALLRQRGGPASATDLALARLKVDVGAQRLALAEQFRGRLTVLAPASGTVTSVLTTPGAAVDAVTPVARVQDLQHLVVTVDLSEFDVSRTRVGLPALVSADALGGRQFGAQVLDVAAGGVDTGGVVNFPVILGLRSHDGLRPGMSVSARVIVRRRRDVVRIPQQAVVDRGGGSTVTVRAASGALRTRPVELGLAGATFVEVRSGLRAGERILVPQGGGGG
jgi:RND family efflux transporter MFP subunit